MLSVSRSAAVPVARSDSLVSIVLSAVGDAVAVARASSPVRGLSAATELSWRRVGSELDDVAAAFRESPFLNSKLDGSDRNSGGCVGEAGATSCTKEGCGTADALEAAAG